MDGDKICDSRSTAYKGGKTFEDCKQEAVRNIQLFSKEIQDTGEISWSRILEIANHDELVYKLSLKFLRLQGYDLVTIRHPELHDLAKLNLNCNNNAKP
jgi:hypothetical protein